MKLDAIDAPALAIERVQLGLMVIGVLGHAHRLRTAKALAIRGKLRLQRRAAPPARRTPSRNAMSVR